ncbi:MAG: hypothetical protein HY514_03250 [Candidatus Aenigmarchaeota archaeon]|nr:hypothetical protein [Candidatus Aenigmarchaeota archaeon]
MQWAKIVSNRLLFWVLVLFVVLLAGAVFAHVSSVTWSRTFTFGIS